jgi:hypothetical protein
MSEVGSITSARAGDARFLGEVDPRPANADQTGAPRRAESMVSSKVSATPVSRD